MLSINSFISKVFSHMNPDEIRSASNYSDLFEWNSLNALIVHINIDKNYGIELDFSDYKNLNTVGDLYRLVKERLERE